MATALTVPAEREAKTGALKFSLTPGHNYRLSDGTGT